MNSHFCKVGKIKPNLSKSNNQKAIKIQNAQSANVQNSKQAIKVFDVVS